MRKKIIMIVIISMCLIGLSPVNHVEADETTQGLQLYFSSNPVVVSPGVNGYFELTIKNIGNSIVRYIDITPNIKDPGVIKWKGNWDVYIGDLSGGSQTTVYFEYEIADDAESGLYQVVFEVDSNIPVILNKPKWLKLLIIAI